MAGAQGIRAGRAYVEAGLNDNPLQAGLKAAEKRLKTFGRTVGDIGSSFRDVGSAVSGFGFKVAKVGVMAASPFGLAIKAAGDMMETSSKLDATFKGNADEVRAWANGYAKEVGRSKAQIQGFSADVGAVLSGFGFDPSAATAMSKTVSALAVDLASFFNMKDDDSLRALISGLTGESEPLKRFGLIVQETQVNAELLNKGIDPSKASQQAKVLARLNLILKGTKDAQGDAVRTAGSFNNSMKALQGQVEDVAVEIGNALLPAATQFVQWAKGAAAVVGKLVTQNTGLIKTAALVAVGVVGAGAALVALGSVIGGVGTVLAGVGAAFGALAGVVGFLATPLGMVAAAAVVGTAAFLKFTDSGGAALEWLGEKFGGFKETALGTFQGIADALMAGDLALAGKVLWAGLELAWLQGVAALTEVWVGFSNQFKSLYMDIGTGLVTFWNNTWGEIRKGISELSIDLLGSWGGMLARMIKMIVPFASAIEALTGTDLAAGLNNALKAFGVGEFEDPNAGAKEKAKAAAGIDAETRAANEAAAEGNAAAAADREAEGRRKIAEALKAVEDAKKEAAAAQQQAKDEAAGTLGLNEHPTAGGKTKSGLPVLTGPGLDEALGKAERTVEVKGSFSAAAARSLGTGDAVADEVKKGNGFLKGINDKLREAGPLVANEP